jgi:dienelactone hydrolase
MLHGNRALLMRILRQIVGVLLFLSGTAAIAAASNPVPLIYEPLLPDAAKPGGAAFTLTVNGSGFVSGAVVHWNGSARTTTFVSKTQLKAAILAADIAKAGTASVTVVNPAPGGGTSNLIFLPVANPASFVSLRANSLDVGAGLLTALALGDFNRDGKLDMAVADASGSTVSILLGNGDGTFQPPVNYSTGAATALAIGDLNGDGKLDLAVANQNGTVSILLGNGDGTFLPATDLSVGSNLEAVAVGDFNSDGKLDLAVADYATGEVLVLLGNGNGTFQTPVSYSTGPASNPLSLAVADFNADGKLDLVVLVVGKSTCSSSTCGTLSVLLGNGNGTFQAAVNYAAGGEPTSIAVGDFNGDGKLDLAVTDISAQTLNILLGNGNGTFQAPVSYGTGLADPVWVDLGDLNGDGKLDLAVLNIGGSDVSVLLGNGNGTFQAAVNYSLPPFSTGLAAGAVGIGDFNGDGKLDVAVAPPGSSTASVLLQAATVTISKTSLNFAPQLVGTTGAVQQTTLTSSGYLPLDITSIAIDGTDAGDFSQTNTCGSSVAPGARCTISVVFKPTQIGPRTANVTISDNTTNSPQSIALSGAGEATGPNVTLSTTSLNFGLGFPVTQSLELTNYGSVALSISGISIKGANPGDFLQTNTCGTSVASAASCTISVTFKPTSSSTFTASLSIADNAPGSPQAVSLSGSGVDVQLNPTSLTFAPINIATNSQESLLTTLTVGPTPLSITGISVSGAYFRLNNSTCGSSVGIGGSCTISVYFYPSTTGTFTGTLSITDNAGVQQVALSGVGCSSTGKPKCPIHALASPGVRSALAARSTATVPRSTGSSPVGTLVTALVDSTREDPFVADGTKRGLLVRFWYPAFSSQNCTPAEYTSTRVWNHFARLTQLPLPAVTTNSCLNTAVDDGTHPVVVFTHGYTGTFTDYTFLFEDLASRGYVVVSIDHTYEATAVEFPDGRFVKSVLGSHLNHSWRTDDDTVSRALSARLEDLTFVMNELERLNASRDNPFAGKLDLTRVALAGHSLGGLTAWLGLQSEPRFKAAILLDPYLADIGSDPTEAPVLLMTMGRQKPSQDECRLWSNLHGPRFLVDLRGAEHVTPSDAVWLAKGAIQTGAMGPEKTIDALRSYIAAFLDTQLRGEAPDVLLEGSSQAFPEVSVTTQEQPMCRQP